MRSINRFIGLLILLTACNSLFIDEDPENTFEENFEVFWQEFDRHYAFFDVKDLAWQAAYDTNVQVVRGFSSEDELFSLLSGLILAFEDGHVNLYRNNTRVAFDYQDGFPLNDPQHAGAYLESVTSPNSTIRWGSIANTNLGYIRIFTFAAPNSHYEQIDEAIATLADKDGIIIDVRNNGGGSDTNSDRVASRFVDRERTYRWIRYRNGSGHEDFSEWLEGTIKPEGNGYDKAVVLLTNKSCFSSTESFILSMKVSPQVSIVGGITGGGSGNPIHRELPNGWTFRLSSWQMVDTDFNFIEGVGILPDETVTITDADADSGIDTILERAIALLESD